MKLRILSSSRSSLPLVSAIAAMLAAPSIHAQTVRTWNAASGAWHTVGNWNPTGTFAGAATGAVTGEGLATDIMAMTAANSASNIGIDMGTMGATGGGVGLTLGGIDFNRTNATALQIGNSSTTVNGILQLDGATINSVAKTLIRVAGSADLTIANVNTGSGTQTMGLRLGITDGIFDVGTSRTLTISSIISQATSGSGFTKTGAGTLTLSGNNSYTGATSISAGTLTLSNTNALGSTNAITIGGASAATLAANVNGITITAPITTANTGVDSTISFAINSGSAAAITLNGAIGGAGNVIFSTPNTVGSGGSIQTINLGAKATYAGSTTINPGSFPTLTVKNTSGAANVLPTGTVLTFGAQVGNGGGRTSTFDLNGQNQTLAGLAQPANIPNDRNYLVTSATAATLTINNTANYSFGGANVDTGVAGSDGTVTSAQITGAISLVKEGSGTFTLGGNLTNGATWLGHTYSGGTTLSGGLTIASLNGAFGSGAIEFSGTATGLQLGGGVNLANNITIGSQSGTGAQGLIKVANGESATLSGTITIKNPAGAGSHFGGTSSTGTGTLNITNSITSTVTVSQRSGTLVLSGGGSYSNFNLAAGTLKLGALNGFSTGSALTIANATGENATFDLAGFNQSLTGITKGSGNISRIGNSSITADSTLTTTGTSNYGGIIQDTYSLGSGATTGNRKVALTVNGGSLTLSGANTYTGITTVNGGTLSVDFNSGTATGSGNQANKINTTSALVLGGGTLAVTGTANQAAFSSTTIGATVTSLGSNRYTVTSTGLGAKVNVGMPITGTGITGGYVVSESTDGATIFSTTAPTASATNWAGAAFNPLSSQTFASTTVNAGASAVTATVNGGTGTAINLSAITRNVGGTVLVTLPTGTQSATNGIQTSTGTADTTLSDSGVVYAYTSTGFLKKDSTNAWLVTDTTDDNTATTLGSKSATVTGIDTTLAADATTVSMLSNLAEARTITATGFTVTTGAVLVGSGATGANGLTITGGTLRSAATVADKDLVLINNGAGFLTINSTIDNAAAGSTGLTKSGTGLVTLGGTNTYTGPTTVNQGTLTLSAAGSIAKSATVNVRAGATLDVSAQSGGWTVGGGTNTQKLTGSGSVTGATIIAGTANNGTHNAGDDAVGKQTFSSSLDYNSGSIFEWNLAATPSETGRGTSYDAVNAASLGATSGAIFRVVLDGAQDFTSTFWDNNRTWSDIFKTSDAGNNLDIASIFTGTTQYYNVTSGSLGTPTAQGSFSFSGSTLQWTAVPEPTSALAGLLLGAGLLRRRRN